MITMRPMMRIVSGRQFAPAAELRIGGQDTLLDEIGGLGRDGVAKVR